MAVAIELHPAVVRFLACQPKRMLIGGEWVEAASGKTFEAFNPATGDALAQVAEADREDVDRAVRAARRAFEGHWAKTKPAQRQLALFRLADLVEANGDELAELEVLNNGMPIAMAKAAVPRVADLLRYYGGWATKIHGETIPTSVPGEYFTYTVREPIGVVGAITPWNGPLVTMAWKLGPALATGCTIVLKPAEQTPLTTLRFGELVLEAGIPAGVVNICPGFGPTAGAALAEHPDVNKVAFTGEYTTGQLIVKASAGNLKRVSLELGGKSPDIVFADADLETAVPGAAWAIFRNSGQVCCAGSRLFVERSIYERFVSRMADYASTIRVGNGLDPNTQMGPLISQEQLERVTGYLRIGKQEGAKPLIGGERATEGELARGYFVPPTVFDGVRPDMRIAREEIFGPVVTAIPFGSVDEVVRLSNNTSYGLAGGVWTRDVQRAHRIAGALQSGVVWVNCYNVFDPAMPFGGYKMSGYGRESGQHALDLYTQVKAVWMRVG
jgi:aldehyde dehydrogenase (NAD+)